MINQSQAIELFNDFQHKVLKNEHWYMDISQYIKATLLYGSTAKGTNREDSDIDILMFVPLDIEEQYTEGEYFYDFKDRQINIVLRSIEKLRLIAEVQADVFQKEVFRMAVIIKADDEVRGLLAAIGNIK